MIILLISHLPFEILMVPSGLLVTLVFSVLKAIGLLPSHLSVQVLMVSPRIFVALVFAHILFRITILTIIAIILPFSAEFLPASPLGLIQSIKILILILITPEVLPLITAPLTLLIQLLIIIKISIMLLISVIFIEPVGVVQAVVGGRGLARLDPRSRGVKV